MANYPQIPWVLRRTNAIMKNNDNKLKPVKAEQPYSYIHRGLDDLDADPNNLDIWKRFGGHGKVTKENLDDALEVRNTAAFDNFPLVGGMDAPEGKSKDYFLKAKDKILGEQNADNIGEFLDNFHGMDYFRKGVPKVEEGLKGTGYDMGPSANIVDNLKEAVDEGDTKEVENIIEEHPEESQEVLPEDTPIQEEAEQITEDTIPQNDEVNNEVVEDFVEESAEDIPFKDIENKPYYDDWVNSEPGSEQFINAYNSVANDYGKEEADKQLEAWGIELPKDEDEVTTETGTDLVEDMSELDNTPLENEAQQIESDTDNLDVDNIEDFEAYTRSVSAPYDAKERKQKENAQKRNYQTLLDNNNQQAWKDYALERDKLNRNGTVRKGWNAQVGKSILAEIMTPEEWANDSLRENVLRHTKFTRDPLTIRNNLKKSIAEEKKALGIDEETLKAKEEAKRQEEAKRKEEEKKRRDEAWAKFWAANDKGKDKGNKKAGSSFINVPPSQEYESTDTNDSSLPALNLQDYHKDVALNGERELDTTETDDVDYRVVEDSDYVPPTYTIDDLDREIEEVSQWPVTNAEEAKAKQKKLKKLKARRVAYGSASTSDTNWNYDKSTATGGRVSPRAGIGSIGGGAGHGSMASTRPTKMGDSHNSIASKAPLPHALEDNQGRVVSINGKATTAPSSNNNGAFRSGSFGLMSKAKSNLKPIPSKAPVSSGPEHMGSSMTVNGKGIPGEINVDDGKQALIGRLKQLLAQLTDEEKKNLGFSPALNQWNGKALDKLDGYTLQNLIDKVEEYIGGE